MDKTNFKFIRLNSPNNLKIIGLKPTKHQKMN